MINKILTLLMIILTANSSGATKILISKTIDHPALDATTRGIMDELAKRGYKNGEGTEIRVESAQGNVPLASQIASKFVAQNPDIIVSIATVSAQSFAKYAREGKVKVVFSTVTDPIGAGLVQSLDKPENNTSGVSNFVPLEPQLKLFKQVQPGLKSLGIIYNAGELNSVSIVKKLEILCPKLGITLIKQTISKTSEASQGATKLAAKADAIFVSNDNTALGALKTIILAAEKAGKPVYVSDTDAVKLGAVLALGPNQYDVGVQTGKMIDLILKGADINNTKVEFPEKTELVINLKAAEIAGIQIPSNLMQQAFEIIK